MAQTINTITSNGIFEISEAEFVSISNSEIEANLLGCKAPITVIIDVPSSVSGGAIICKGAEKGYADKRLDLISGKLNVFRMETKGFKDLQGITLFTSEGLTNSGAKIAFLKYSAVINH